MTNQKTNTLLIGAALVIGAMFYARQARAKSLPRAPLGTGSLPGSVGTGANQVIGGAIGAFFQSLGLSKPPSDKADPVSGLTNSQQQQVDLRRGEILQENAGYNVNWDTGLTDGEQAQIDLRRQEIVDTNNSLADIVTSASIDGV